MVDERRTSIYVMNVGTGPHCGCHGRSQDRGTERVRAGWDVNLSQVKGARECTPTPLSPLKQNVAIFCLNMVSCGAL